ncbi:MAG: ABC transporter ATP-binding protein [Lachnospiraceae bacterium]|nr:ABC transporter ATP-binding protein [Lachnospiraceae bacterium]
MGEYAIDVRHVTKLYKLYDKPSDRFKESLGLSKEKKYREHYALHDLNFTVKKGECVGIIGTNGAGKSTILKIITGVLNPTEGNVEIDGRISALLELGAGFNMEYTGMENIYLNGTMIGFSREEIDRKMDSILSFADIGDFINQPVKTYSSGMFVRLAFAVAINIDPEILIVDEALSVGDVFFQAKCFKKFEEFKDRGKTILFVSHDMGSIQKYCDRAILLNKGTKLAEGEPKEIVDIYKKVLVNQYDEAAQESANIHQEDDEKRETLPETDIWKVHFAVNPDCIEYGDKEIEITDYGIFDDGGLYSNCVMNGSYFTVKFKVRFNKKIDDPIFAMTIKDVHGTEIAGTNTMYEKIDINNIEQGMEKEISFRQMSHFRNGEYLISLGCTGYFDGDFVVYHRLYDILSLNVICDKDLVGFFDMGSEIRIQ